MLITLGVALSGCFPGVQFLDLGQSSGSPCSFNFPCTCGRAHLKITVEAPSKVKQLSKKVAYRHQHRQPNKVL
jgi:hypothetical protein